MEVSRTDKWRDWVPQLAEAGLIGDRQRLELIIVSMIRALKRESPDMSLALGSILAQYSTNPNGLRWTNVGPPPTDSEEGLALLNNVPLEGALPPILPSHVLQQVEEFIRERQNAQLLLRQGFTPPCSLLITGLPGTGKTMLARWLALSLGLPLLVQDLATSISSFLGKTGLNLRRTLDFARVYPCVLLLDEFDAIAKRRDDATEVGELKRIVNVLLKELEQWPLHSVLVAATNHPDLLDRAVRRRFDVVLELPMPGEEERFKILERAAQAFSTTIPAPLLAACASSLDGSSGSELEAVMRSAIRKHVTANRPISESLLEQVQVRRREGVENKAIGPMIRALRSSSSKDYSVRELASLFGKSASTIQHHLKKEA
jgi:hypothetical protein